MTFRHNFLYLDNSFDFPVMINILYEMIKVLHEKMLNTICLYWFHNDTLAENNSLNSLSKKRRFQVRHISCQVNSSCFNKTKLKAYLRVWMNFWPKPSSKMMINAFHFTKKALFVFKLSKFCWSYRRIAW